MKVALVGPARPFRGGISQYNTQLYFHLRQRHEVLLLNFSRQYPSFLFPGRTQLEEFPGEVLGERLIDSVQPLSWRRAGRRIREFRPALVLFQSWHPFFAFAYGSLLRSLRKQPLNRIILCHNVFPHERLAGRLGKGLERLLLRALFSQADGFLTHSSEMAREIRGLGTSGPIRLIGHPVYPQFGAGRGPTPVSPKQTPLRLLFFGNIRPYKGLDLLIRSLSLLPPDLTWELRVAGEFYGNERELKRLARQLGVDRSIQWESRYIPDQEVAEHFRWASVLVAPYREASQSGVVPVAYQFELPVITTRVGGLPEVVRHLETGLLVGPADPSALARAIVEFSRIRDRIAWSGNIRQLLGRFSWERVEDAILSFSVEQYSTPGTAGGLDRNVQKSQETE